MKPAGGLQEGAPGDQGDGLLGLARGEVVQQDQVGAGLQHLADLLERVDLHLDGEVGELLADPLERLGDPMRPRSRGCP